MITPKILLCEECSFVFKPDWFYDAEYGEVMTYCPICGEKHYLLDYQD